MGDDPTYQQIYEGTWLNNEPYGVIHRLATNGKQKGVSDVYKRQRERTVAFHPDQEQVLLQTGRCTKPVGIKLSPTKKKNVLSISF